MSDGTEDKVLPWTVKGIVPEARNAAIAAAKRERQPLGEWISRAIRTQIQSDRQQDRAPVPVAAERPEIDLGEVERMVAMAAQLAGAGAPPPKSLSRVAYSLMRERLAAMKGPGQGPVRPKKVPGRTETRDGQTED
jgi:hypothetical protein